MKQTLLLLATLLMVVVTKAQHKQPYLALTLYNHSFSAKLFPRPLNLGLALEYGLSLNKKEKNRWYVPISLLYINHRNLYQAVGISAGIQYKHVGQNGFVKGGDFSIGYLQSFDVYQRYAQTSKGKYEKVGDPGRGSLLPAIRLSLGYDFSKKGELPLELFTRYQLALQSPFSGAVPFIPQLGFQLGAGFNLNQQ